MSSSVRKQRQQAGLELEQYVTVRIPAPIHLAIEEASKRELSSKSIYVRRALLRSLRADGLIPELPAGSRAGLAEEMSPRAAVK